MTSVRAVQTLSAGVDHVLPSVKSLRPGVMLCNARGVHEASTAELTLTLILASLRGIPDFVRGQDDEEWRSGFRPSLADKSVLIVGYGSIGSAIEDRLAPFELARVARVARSARTTERGPVRPLTELPSLLPESDVVVLSTPLTESTRGLVDAEFLSRMKDGALLVNVARGPVVDTKALLAELESGRITAALDVTDPEPLPHGPSAVARARRAHQSPCRRPHLGVLAAREAAARATADAFREPGAAAERGSHHRHLSIAPFVLRPPRTPSAVPRTRAVPA